MSAFLSNWTSSIGHEMYNAYNTSKGYHLPTFPNTTFINGWNISSLPVTIPIVLPYNVTDKDVKHSIMNAQVAIADLIILLCILGAIYATCYVLNSIRERLCQACYQCLSCCCCLSCTDRARSDAVTRKRPIKSSVEKGYYQLADMDVTSHSSSSSAIANIASAIDSPDEQIDLNL